MLRKIPIFTGFFTGITILFAFGCAGGGGTGTTQDAHEVKTDIRTDISDVADVANETFNTETRIGEDVVSDVADETTCTPGTPDCACDRDDKCDDGLVCDADKKTCRKPKTCDEANCKPHQKCAVNNDGIAECLEDCEKGWQWDATGKECREVIKANCTAGAAGSILANCQAKNRKCIEDANGANCGDCYDGFIEEAGTCRTLKTCADLGCATANRACTPATVSTDAACGACLSGFIEENGTCRALKTCADLGCDALHRKCTEATAIADAVCGNCLDGYLVQGENCVAPADNCRDDGNAGSLLQKCADRHRECVEATRTAGEPAHCGNCVDGYAEDTNGDCQETHTCEDLGCYDKGRRCIGEDPFHKCGSCREGMVQSDDNPDICVIPKTCKDLQCADDEFCVEGNLNQNAECVKSKCPEGKAWREDSLTCVTCYVSCNATDPGETGRVWPFTMHESDSCICETRDKWYWDQGERLAKQCDADGDGWVREPARMYIESTDKVLKENARCNLHQIDRFTLENEYKQRLDIYLCKGDPAFKHAGQGMCDEMVSMPLYESVRNDDQNALDQAVDLHAYALDGNGRRPMASELNGLTRMCTVGDDYNNDGISDISEWHGMPKGNMTSEQYILAQFSYYMELDKGWYESIPGQPFGRYVIKERSRCDKELPVKYADADNGYWKQCTRGRDTAFDATDGPNAPDFNMEFAAWDCDNKKGGCRIPPPPTQAVPVEDQAPAHGLCDGASLPPKDAICKDNKGDASFTCVDGGVWRGMNHHSQFKCVVLNAESSNTGPRMDPADANTAYEFNQCHIQCPAGDANCAMDCDNGRCTTSSQAPGAGAANPWQPKLVCEVQPVVSQGMVGFASILFHNTLPYTNGCINEWTPNTVQGNINGSEDPVVSAWRGMCPGWTNSPDATIGQGNPGAFGELQCGCGNNFGGIGCEMGCPQDTLHLSPGYQATPRQGYWMCANVVSTVYTNGAGIPGEEFSGKDAQSSQWTLTGGVPSTPTDGTVLCQDNKDCSNGWSLRP